MHVLRKANYSQGDAGYYGPGNVCNGNFWNMVDAVAQHAGKVVTTQGVPGATSTVTSGIPAAVAMAKTADTVVLVVGTDLAWAAEGHDATQINFTSAQVQLMDGVIAAATNPVVIVLLTATPLDISAYLSNPKVGAILHAGQPSVTTLGVGDVLYGLKVPAGRMVQTIYPASYQDEISIFDFNMYGIDGAFSELEDTAGWLLQLRPILYGGRRAPISVPSLELARTLLLYNLC